MSTNREWTRKHYRTEFVGLLARHPISRAEALALYPDDYLPGDEWFIDEHLPAVVEFRALAPLRLLSTEEVDDHYLGVVTENCVALGPDGRRYQAGEDVTPTRYPIGSESVP